ncbi:MAG: Protein hit [Phycisphaerae bacterium]|nr:Protein hit [Phycisphaerae bacterium]
MNNCIFCRIAAGDIPAHVIYSNQVGLAFLDIRPLAAGHTLWIPKQHYGSLDEITDHAAVELLKELPRLAKTVRDVTDSGGYNILLNNGTVAGQEVAHVHFHIIPRREDDDLGYRWLAGEYPDGQAEALQERLHRVLMNHA